MSLLVGLLLIDDFYLCLDLVPALSQVIDSHDQDVVLLFEPFHLLVFIVQFLGQEDILLLLTLLQLLDECLLHVQLGVLLFLAGCHLSDV